MRKGLFLAKRWLMDRRQIGSASELQRAEQMSADELAKLNWQRRREIVRYAFDHNPFYHKKYAAAGFETGDLKDPADFNKLPILEKQEIRDNLAEMVSRGFDAASLKTSTTGGSTGVPLKLYCDPAAPGNEVSWRTLRWWGVDVSDNSAYLYRAVPTGTGRIMQKALLWPTKRNWIAALDMDETRMEQFHQRLLADRPKYLVGYVGAIDVFAGFMEKRGLKLDGLKAVWTTAAPLPEGKRHYLQQVLGAPVYTQYGSCEFYWIAAECDRQSGMHVSTDIRHVDVVDGDTAVPVGEFGDLVVTDLMSRAFPLIRYRLGDRGRLLEHRCDCELPFPLMDYVDGRISDTVCLPDGSRIPGEALGGIFRGFPNSIKSFQVRQAADYHLTIRYEPMPGVDCTQVTEDIRGLLDEKLKHQVGIDFEIGSPEASENGKPRFLVSEVKS